MHVVQVELKSLDSLEADYTIDLSGVATATRCPFLSYDFFLTSRRLYFSECLPPFAPYGISA